MCGIVLAANKKGRVSNRVYELYRKQIHRGTEGYGYISIQNGVIVNLKRGLKENCIRDSLLKDKSELILFHHRHPTSTDNTLGTTHPIFVSNDELEYDYYVMHNGGVTNDEFLKKKHEELGYKYTTEFREYTYAQHTYGGTELLDVGNQIFNDSECLAIEAARFIEGLQDKMNNLGGAAFFVVQTIKGTDTVNSVYYAQNYGRQLGFKKKKGWTIVASEYGKEVPQLKMFQMNPTTFEVTESELDMDDAIKYPKSTPSPYTPSMGFGSQEDDRTIPDNTYGLVNAHYTKAEAEESGAPMSAFFTSTRMYIDGEWQMTYVPAYFTGKDSTTRPLFRDEYYLLPEPSVDKAQERLEELAMKYARKQHEHDYLSDAFVSDSINKQTYQSRTATLDKELVELEEEMSTLGIEDTLVEETVNTAQELVSYDYMGRIK